MSDDPLKGQIGGEHYRFMAIQPMEFSHRNHWDAAAHTTLKYLSRFRDKNGQQDLEKALHCLQLRHRLTSQRGLRETMVEFLFPQEGTREKLAGTGFFHWRRWPALPMEEYCRLNGYHGFQEAALMRLEDYVYDGCEASFLRATTAIYRILHEEYPNGVSGS